MRLSFSQAVVLALLTVGTALLAVSAIQDDWPTFDRLQWGFGGLACWAAGDTISRIPWRR